MVVKVDIRQVRRHFKRDAVAVDANDISSKRSEKIASERERVLR
jgi:hypothetical protein